MYPACLMQRDKEVFLRRLDKRYQIFNFKIMNGIDYTPENTEIVSNIFLKLYI